MKFEDWVKCIFDRPEGPDPWYFDYKELPPSITPAESVRNLRKLFSESRELLSKYSNRQVRDGLWYIIDSGHSSEFAALLDGAPPLSEKLAAIEAISLLYKDCFLERCDNALSHLAEAKENPLNVLCYMWWDVAPLPATLGKLDSKEIDAACLDVMRKVLLLNNDACRESALHGLNHSKTYYPSAVKEIVSGFLSTGRTLRAELLRYARAAAEGAVQ